MTLSDIVKEYLKKYEQAFFNSKMNFFLLDRAEMRFV